MIIVKEHIEINLNEIHPKKAKDILKQVKSDCKFTNPVYMKAKKMGFQYRHIPPQLYTYDYDDVTKYLYVYRGYLQTLISDFGLEFEYQTGSNPIEKDLKITFTPRLYQQNCINHILENDYREGFIWGECACGKTFLGMQLICELKEKTLVIVHTKFLAEQWKRNILENTNIGEKDIAIFGDGKKKLGNVVTIALIQSLNKVIERIPNEFGLCILDEMHKCPAPTFTRTMNCINSKYRFGLTATPKRKDGMHVIIPHVVGNIMYHIDKKMVEGDDCGVISQCIIRPTNFVYLGENEKILKRQIKLKAIMRGVEEKDKERANILRLKSEETFYYDEYINQIMDDDERNSMIINDVIKEVKLGKKCLISCDRIDHCVLLNNLLNENNIASMTVIGGKADSLKVKDIYKYVEDLMNANDLDVVVGTPGCITDAMSIPILSVLYLTCPSFNNPDKLKQQKGRVERVHKPSQTFNGKKLSKTYVYWDQNVNNYSVCPKKKLQNIFGKTKVRIMKQTKKIDII